MSQVDNVLYSTAASVIERVEKPFFLISSSYCLSLFIDHTYYDELSNGKKCFKNLGKS